MVETANVIFADGPLGAPQQPNKALIRAWGTWLESFLTSIGANAGSVYVDRASLYADLTRSANSMAWVIQDPVAAYNGIYRKIGAANTGSWSRVADLPFSFIIATDAGAGTPSAIKATTSIPVSSSSLVWVTLSASNNLSPVTISFNGGAPLTIKTNSGNDPAIGGLAAGMTVMGIVSGSTFRLVSDQASAALVTQMEQLLIDAVADFTAQTQTLRDQAVASAAASASSATDAASYALMVGAAVYDFSFDSDPSTPGYDWSNS